MKPNVAIRATLYALIALTTPVIGILTNSAADGCWPSPVEWAGAAATGCGAALVSLRAFIDGTNERAKNGSNS